MFLSCLQLFHQFCLPALPPPHPLCLSAHLLDHTGFRWGGQTSKSRSLSYGSRQGKRWTQKKNNVRFSQKLIHAHPLYNKCQAIWGWLLKLRKTPHVRLAKHQLIRGLDVRSSLNSAKFVAKRVPAGVVRCHRIVYIYFIWHQGRQRKVLVRRAECTERLEKTGGKKEERLNTQVLQ